MTRNAFFHIYALIRRSNQTANINTVEVWFFRYKEKKKIKHLVAKVRLFYSESTAYLLFHYTQINDRHCANIWQRTFVRLYSFYFVLIGGNEKKFVFTFLSLVFFAMCTFKPNVHEMKLLLELSECPCVWTYHKTQTSKFSIVSGGNIGCAHKSCFSVLFNVCRSSIL